MIPDRPLRTVEALIVSYNTKALLRETISSLKSSSRTDRLSIAVFDNASSDGSAEMVEREFPDARVIRSETNTGFAAANNALAATSEADYLLLLNSDVVVETDVVTTLLDALEAHPNAAAAGPRLVGTDGAVQLSSQSFPTLRLELARAILHSRLAGYLHRVFDADGWMRDALQLDRTAERAPRETEFLWATCWLLRRSEIEEHGLFDVTFGTYGEDLDFCFRAAKRGRRMVYIPSAQMLHLGGQSSTPAAKRRLEDRGRVRFYRKHRGLLAAGAASALLRARELRLARFAARRSAAHS